MTPIWNFDRPNWFFTFSNKRHNIHKHKISKHVFVDCRVIKLCPITNFQLNQTAFYFSFQKGSPCTSKVINPFLDIFHCSILKYFLGWKSDVADLVWYYRTDWRYFSHREVAGNQQLRQTNYAHKFSPRFTQAEG